jgi:hypothetical protein
LSDKGEKYVEGGLERDGKPLAVMRRPTSWYDHRLVTATGERILADIDDKAIIELRDLKLVWSGWGDKNRLPSDNLVVQDGQGFRPMRIVNGDVLRLFFLSIVWRAGASSLADCRWVELTEPELDDLRKRIVSRDPGPATDYPIQLFQLITRGHAHNRTPLLELQPVPKRDGSGPIDVHCVRIYLDGLVAYVYLPHRTDAAKLGYFDFCVGVKDIAVVMTHEFEKSRTYANMREMILVTEWSKRRPLLPQTKVYKAIRQTFGKSALDP